jgi:hypothetical protein
MGKFKFEKYDYTKVVKRKVHIHYKVTDLEYEALNRAFNVNGEELIEIFVRHLKRSYINEYAGKNSYKYNINDFNWEWEIITPNGTYKSNETGS